MGNNRGSVKRTLRERKFIKAYIENSGNATEAYLAVNPKIKRENASVYGMRMLEKVSISVTELLESMGTTDFKLNQKLNEGLEATKVISVIPIPPEKDKPSTGDLPDAGSKNIEFVDVPDFNVRVKYLDMAYKLKDKYPIDKSRFELTGAGGEPIRYIIESTYEKPDKGDTEEKEEKIKEPEELKSGEYSGL